jgi:dienelactone hydrolase
MPSARRRRLLSQAKRLIVWLAVAGLLATAAGLVYFGTPLRGSEAGIAAVESADDIVLEPTGEGGYVMRPPGGPTDRGLVFYPGGRVHPDAYLATLAPLVTEAHLTVVVPKPPLNLAVLDPGAADAVVAAHPAVDRWYVGGHSLGGAMACRYAAGAGDRVAGLVLYASYCDRDVSDRSLAVLSVTGSADAVLNREAYRAGLARLPADARVVELAGVNHSQFGDYTGQPGGAPASRSYDDAHAALRDVTLAWLHNQTAG